MVIDCVVVGAGPAGLAVSVALTGRGVDHVVLERGRAGQSWRSQRWDSLRLNNPGWMNPMLGDQPADTLPDPCRGRPAAGRPRRLLPGPRARRRGPAWSRAPAGGSCVPGTATSAPAPSSSRPGTRTCRAHRGWPDGSRRGSGTTTPRTTARRRDCPTVPCWSWAAHSPATRSPRSCLPPAGGWSWRPVPSAGHQAGTAAATPFEWLVECGFFDQRPRDLADPSVLRAPQPLLAPGGRSVSLQTLARSGATLAGRLVAVDGERVSFDASAPANVAAADAFATRVRAMLDEVIRRTGRDVPPAAPDEADMPVELHPPSTLHLRAHDIGSVVWCTGYAGDFRWLDPGLTDAGGRPVRQERRRPHPGSGTSGCAGSPAAAPATSSASPSTRPRSPTRSRPRSAATRVHCRSGRRPFV